MRALIIGGSLGGLAAAHELTAIGADVTVYERSVDRTQPRGAGIVMQPEVESLLARLGRSVPSVCVKLTERQQLHRGGAPTRYAAPQWMTAWDTLYDALRGPLGSDRLRLNSKLDHLDVQTASVAATFGDGHDATGDFLVGADGVGSTTRTLLTGRNDLTYSGYVAYRGLEPESALSPALHELLSERFTMFAVPGLQMLCYLVPGPDGEREPGSRRINWVLYVNTREEDLPSLLTGRTGRRYDQFLPPGELTTDSETTLRDLADRELPEPMAELLALSKVFLQPVFDLPPSSMSMGRVALIGDAAGTVRPHTASGTSKAMGDAAALAQALHGWEPPAQPPSGHLQTWAASRTTHLRLVAGMGVRLAAQSSLGTAGPRFSPSRESA
ncbi:monooxygenase [Mycobacterium sp. djl-10]|nr:monooxygenase [Mycobacterium sp. djl-10]